MPNYITVDIETGPLAREQLDLVKPNFRATRAKKPEKVAEEIAEKEEKFYDDAALDPTTGRVLAIGYRENDKTTILADDDESVMLENWWSLWRGNKPTFDFTREWQMIGFNLLDFDLPFLVNRAWIIGVEVPFSFLDLSWRERQGNIKDVMAIWNLKRYKRSYKSLNSIAASMGVGGKKTENSRLFFQLWAENREEAISHLRNDLIITEAVWRRMLLHTATHQI